MAMEQQQLTIPFSSENPKKYSDQDLLFFKQLIQKKLDSAITQLTELKEILSGTTENDTKDTSWGFKADDGAQNSTKDETTILAHKQEVFIVSLQNALIRIEKGTYGICIHTGELIDRNRLMAVPGTTTSLLIKTTIQNQITIQNEINDETQNHTRS